MQMKWSYKVFAPIQDGCGISAYTTLCLLSQCYSILPMQPLEQLPQLTWLLLRTPLCFHPRGPPWNNRYNAIISSTFQVALWNDCNKFPPQSPAMIKSHLDQTRQNQRSTKPRIPLNNDIQSDPFPTSTLTGESSHFCYATVSEPTGQIY